MKLDLFDSDGRIFYEANIWRKDGGDPVMLEIYTTKAEATTAIKRYFTKRTDKINFDCFVKRFDRDGFCEDSWTI